MPFLSAARLRAETFVRTVEIHAELGSTNDRAFALAKENAEVPALVLAERQTAGRGRGANRWTAPPGTLTFTLLLDPPAFSAESETHVASLAPLTGLAVAETAAGRTTAEVGVKWPNDVLLRLGPTAPWGKMAGVLCETAPGGAVLIGIGLNLNSDPADFPSNLARPPASLRRNGERHDPVDFLIDLLVRLEAGLNAFSIRGALDSTRWATRDVLAGRAVTIRGAREVRGTACGIDEHGALRVFDGQAIHAVRSGTVDW